MERFKRIKNINKTLKIEGDFADVGKLMRLVADGHSLSADVVMFIGGGSGGYYLSQVNTCDLKQFSSSANAVDHGDMIADNYMQAVGSDGTQVMSGGGYAKQGSAKSVIEYCEIKKFLTSTTAISHGDLNIAKQGLVGGSDGMQVMFCGGKNAHTLKTCEMKQFSSTSTAVDHGNLIIVKHSSAAGSDGSQLIIGGGYTSSYISACEMKQFSSIATAEPWGSLISAKGHIASASDSTQIMFGGGFNAGSYIKTCEIKHCASASSTFGYGELLKALYGASAGSDGTQVIFGGGTPSMYTQTDICELKEFSSSSNAIDHGTLSQNRMLLSGASGTSS